MIYHLWPRPGGDHADRRCVPAVPFEKWGTHVPGAPEARSVAPLLKQLAQRVIWKYGVETSPATLERHARWAATVLGIYLTASAVMFSSTLEFLVAPPGPWRDAWFVVVAISTGAALLLMLPAVFLAALAREACRELRSRGFDSAVESHLNRRLARSAMRCVAYFLALLAVGNGLARVPGMQPFAVGASCLLTVIVMVRLVVQGRRRA